MSLRRAIQLLRAVPARKCSPKQRQGSPVGRNPWVSRTLLRGLAESPVYPLSIDPRPRHLRRNCPLNRGAHAAIAAPTAVPTLRPQPESRRPRRNNLQTALLTAQSRRNHGACANGGTLAVPHRPPTVATSGRPAGAGTAQFSTMLGGRRPLLHLRCLGSARWGCVYDSITRGK